MGIADVGMLSLGEWIAIAKVWKNAHDPEDALPSPPTQAEFEAAVARARGLH